MAMDRKELTESFLRHVATLLDGLHYPDVSRQGTRVANAYRLARKELRKINEKRNILPPSSASLLSEKTETTLPPHPDNGKRSKRGNH